MTTFEAILPQHIDSTMMNSFKSCPQKWYREFVLGLRLPGLKVDLHAGAAFATSLEHFYTSIHRDNAPTNTALEQAIRALLLYYGDYEPPAKSAKTADRMVETLFDFIATYPPHTDHVQPLIQDGRPTLEFSFAVPLDFPGFPLHPVSHDPFLYSGRFDMLASYRGRPCVRDEKTTGYSDAHWADKWDLRAQFMGYVWACQASGIDLDTVIVRGVVIQKTQIKQLEAIKIYPDFMIARWFEQLKRDLNRLVSCWNEGYFDFNLGDSCTAYSLCSFFDLCRSKEPENWMSNYTVARWNPLLKNPIAEELTHATT